MKLKPVNDSFTGFLLLMKNAFFRQKEMAAIHNKATPNNAGFRRLLSGATALTVTSPEPVRGR
jgi:hypothetical protein